jgi:hypothetical protein
VTVEEEKSESKPAKEISVEVPSYAHLNLYSEDVDMPCIWPRTEGTKNIFYVDVPETDQEN